MEDNKEKARPLTENLNYRETVDGEIELTLRIPSPMDHAGRSSIPPIPSLIQINLHCNNNN